MNAIDATKKEEFDVTVKSAFNGEYQYSTETFDNFDDALAAAKPHINYPIQLNEHCDYETSVTLAVYNRFYDENGKHLQESEEMIEIVDLFLQFDLDEDEILRWAEEA
jgi:hypothetical protein